MTDSKKDSEAIQPEATIAAIKKYEVAVIVASFPSTGDAQNVVDFATFEGFSGTAVDAAQAWEIIAHRWCKDDIEANGDDFRYVLAIVEDTKALRIKERSVRVVVGGGEADLKWARQTAKAVYAEPKCLLMPTGKSKPTPIPDVNEVKDKETTTEAKAPAKRPVKSGAAKPTRKAGTAKAETTKAPRGAKPAAPRRRAAKADTGATGEVKAPRKAAPRRRAPKPEAA